MEEAGRIIGLCEGFNLSILPLSLKDRGFKSSRVHGYLQSCGFQLFNELYMDTLFLNGYPPDKNPDVDVYSSEYWVLQFVVHYSCGLFLAEFNDLQRQSTSPQLYDRTFYLNQKPFFK